MSHTWCVHKKNNGTIIACGFTDFVAGAGEVIAEYDDVQNDVIATFNSQKAAVQESLDTQIAAFDAKVADESITHLELVQLLKLKKYI
jgi:hypothetical protein